MTVESRSTSKLDDFDQFTREGRLKEAVELLELIEKERIRVDLPRFMALANSCGENEALAEAKSVHKHLAKSMAHLENGHGEESLELFAEFKLCGIRPDGQMFLGVFLACGVISDVVEGMLQCESMMKWRRSCYRE
ncbi:pentatricopeptide repeat-containing protein, mitochondrial-like protein [Salvia divinorum]|uniref:Pentatricopeptide repeat-containing protein, mitochondrial-like protein n=1 Tax=Salvia divinorum TaxID=28513 RepID=A0ABD1H5W5_SALDI